MGKGAVICLLVPVRRGLPTGNAMRWLVLLLALLKTADCRERRRFDGCGKGKLCYLPKSCVGSTDQDGLVSVGESLITNKMCPFGFTISKRGTKEPSFELDYWGADRAKLYVKGHDFHNCYPKRAELELKGIYNPIVSVLDDGLAFCRLIISSKDLPNKFNVSMRHRDSSGEMVMSTTASSVSLKQIDDLFACPLDRFIPVTLCSDGHTCLNESDIVIAGYPQTPVTCADDSYSLQVRRRDYTWRPVSSIHCNPSNWKWQMEHYDDDKARRINLRDGLMVIRCAKSDNDWEKMLWKAVEYTAYHLEPYAMLIREERKYEWAQIIVAAVIINWILNALREEYIRYMYAAVPDVDDLEDVHEYSQTDKTTFMREVDEKMKELEAQCWNPCDGIPFHDRDFPAGNHYIKGLKLDTSLDQVEWLRASQRVPISKNTEMRSSSFKGWKKKSIQMISAEQLDIDDVYIGELADSYIVAPLSCLSIKPHLVRRVLVTPTLNEEGIYHVRLFLYNTWHLILVDDLLPSIPDQKGLNRYELLFAYTRSNEQLWAPLIEKAFAKAFGGYNKIPGSGYRSNIFSALTGAPVIIHMKSTFRDKDELWEHLNYYCKKGYLMTTAFNNTQEAKNLHIGYYYPFAIVGVRTELQGNLRLVMIRHAGMDYIKRKFKCTFVGDTWQKKLGKKLSNVRRGCFWLTFADFYRCLDNIDVCAIDKYVTELRCPLILGGERDVDRTVLEIDVTEYSEIFATVRTRPPPIGKMHKVDDVICDTFICVHKREEDGALGQIENVVDVSYYESQLLHLEPGQYTLLLHHIHRMMAREVTIMMQSKALLSIRRVVCPGSQALHSYLAAVEAADVD